MDTFREKYGLSTGALKLVALISMLIDHIGVFVCRYESDLYWICRKIGRLSFPIFAFCLVVGFVNTHSKSKYVKRLFIFALISEIPFDLVIYTARLKNNFSVRAGYLRLSVDHQNVFFTLLIGFVTIWCVDEIKKNIEYQKKREVMLMFEATAVAAGGVAAWLLKTDYGINGVMLICMYYLFFDYIVLIAASNIFFNCVLYEGVQRYGVLSLGFIFLYNQKPGSKKLKWFFYLFYPVHLFALAAIDYCFVKIRS